jgi:hypothetical protein
MNSPQYPNRSEESLKDKFVNTKETVYALDYDSALKITDGQIEVISEGKYLKFN